MKSKDADRYARQRILKQIGPEGQRRLARSRVAIIGCGALGTHQAELLARAGVGFLRIVDRDVVELSNLPRQALFDEQDVAQRRPKAQAATAKLKRINSEITIEPQVAEFCAGNAEELIESVEVVLDACDNFETRYLLNDACVKHQVPWIYGGVLGTSGMSLAVLPNRGPCLRCLFPRPPEPGSVPTTESEGVLGAAPAAIAARQATDAMRVLLQDGSLQPRLSHFDLWTGEYRTIEVFAHPDCPCCGRRQFEFLEGAIR